MQRQLPLSWTETSSNDIEYIHLKLPNAHFIPFATLPETVSLDDFLCHLDQVLNAPIIIRGVPHRAIKMLPGGTYWSFASEAVLRSESFSPSKSLQDLNKRGLRHGTVQEVHSQEGKEHIGTLWNASVYSNSQPFRFLFRHLPSSRDRTFIFRHPTTPRTLAVVFFSQRTHKSFHLERFIRMQNAPVGIMEALLMKALSTLFEEGACEISLGEVPFAHPNEEIESVPQPMFLTMLHPILKKVISRRIRLKTLQAFKQKFLPEWRPVYVYSSRRLLLHDLTHLAFLTNSLPFIHQEKDAIQSFKAFKLRAPTLCPTSSSLYSTGIPFSWRS